jgi:hypothetical protein
LDRKKLIGIATDGASSITCISTALVARLKAKNPQLVAVHCVYYCETLAKLIL